MKERHLRISISTSSGRRSDTMVDILSNGLERLGIKDDVRKARIVMKYEMMKFFSGKKIFIFGGIALAVLILLTVAYIINGEEKTSEQFCVSLLSFVTIISLLGATLFSSVTLVSEFEEKTALVLFTKPIGRSSIFVGKFLAALILNLGTIIIYYILTIIITAILTKGVPVAAGASLFYACVYTFTLTGFAILFSSFMKKASTSTILTFVFLFLGLPIIEVIVAAVTGGLDVNNGTIDTWYFPDIAAGCIQKCIADPMTGAAASYTDGLRDTLVMLIWGIVPTVAAYYIFKRRTL